MVLEKKMLQQSDNIRDVSRVVLIVERPQNIYFHACLTEICGLVLDDLDGDRPPSIHVLALDNLAKRASSQHVDDNVVSYGAIDKEDQVMILIVEVPI